MKPLILLAALAMQAAIASSPADYANVIPIETSADSAAWQFELDDAVYAGSVDPDLRDLAVFNADGQPVPMTISAIETADSLVEQRATVPVLALPSGHRGEVQHDLQLIVERDASGRLRRLETQSSKEVAAESEAREWLLDLGGFERGIDHLELDWSEPRTNVIARFELTGSNDLQRWDLLNADATVVLIEQDGARIERRAIDVSPTRLRYLRLRRTDHGTPLLGLAAQASRVRQVAAAARVRWLQARAVDTLGGQNASETRHLYALDASVPASEVRIDLSSDNTVAQLDVLAPSDDAVEPTRWTHRARLVAFRLSQDGDVIDNGNVALTPGPRMRSLRVDSATPLSAPPRVAVGYRPARVVFLAEGHAPFVLAVGSASARSANYPIEAALVSLRARYGKEWQPPSAELGKPQASAGAKALRAAEPPTHWKSWLLWGVLIAAVAVVAGIAITLLRGAAQGGGEQGQQPPEK